MMEEDFIRDILWYKSLAKQATAKAKQLEITLRQEFNEIGLDATEVGPYKLQVSHQSVDWDADIIDTIKTIKGVSEDDKEKLFMPIKRKANGVHLNSIAKKYGKTVADRIQEARKESGETFKISTDRMENNLIDDAASEFLHQADDEEQENEL
tara:strand:+ start:1489 stop:1947 length:459 start_codon:yes stop_codon:yes gene_type:complete